MKTVERVVPWACIAAGFGIWIAAVASMAAIPQDEGPAARVQEPTGLVFLYQDPKTLETVALRETRDRHAL
jgi:hypothetical protein